MVSTAREPQLGNPFRDATVDSNAGPLIFPGFPRRGIDGCRTIQTPRAAPLKAKRERGHCPSINGVIPKGIGKGGLGEHAGSCGHEPADGAAANLLPLHKTRRRPAGVLVEGIGPVTGRAQVQAELVPAGFAACGR